MWWFRTSGWFPAPGPSPVPPDGTEVRLAARGMAADYLRAYAARVREASGKDEPGRARDEAAAGWAKDRSAAFAKWLGDRERSIAPGPGEPTEAQKAEYRRFLREIADGFGDAAGLVAPEPSASALKPAGGQIIP